MMTVTKRACDGRPLCSCRVCAAVSGRGGKHERTVWPRRKLKIGARGAEWCAYAQYTHRLYRGHAAVRGPWYIRSPDSSSSAAGFTHSCSTGETHRPEADTSLVLAVDGMAPG